MKAMILAAGFGTRLFPLTIDRTKPAIPFLGKPLVGYVAEYIAKFGFKDIVVNLHHQPESVKAALGDGSRFGVEIHYTLETPKILGTAGALDNARHLLEGGTFLIINGKIITDIDIRAALETHRSSGALATMVLKPNKRREKFTIVDVEDGLIKGFPGDPDPNDTDSPVPMMFTGIHIFESRVFDYIPRGVYSDIVPVFYRPAIANGEKIVAHITDGHWNELSTIPRYLDISLAVCPPEKNRVIMGDYVQISDSASVTDSVIWDNVRIGANASLNRCIIADGVTVKSGEKFENVAIVRADMLQGVEVPEKGLKGFEHDDNYIVSLV